MAEVRSAVLGRGHVTAAGSHVLVTGVAGMTLLIKTAYVSGSMTASQQMSLYVNHASPAVLTYLIFVTLATGIQTANWQGWIVLAPGDQLVMGKTTAEAIDYWISGAALHGVESTFIPQPPT